MANFQHDSNGGFEQPNRGVNYPSASLGIRYNPVSNKFPVYQRIKDTGWNKKPEYKIGIFYSPKDGYNAAWQTRRKNTRRH